MKNKLYLLLAVLAISVKSFATTFTVHVSNNVFTPSTLTMQMGDVIMWVWDNGTHTTTSGSIPTGAAPWDAPIDNTNTSFSYTPTKVGTYNYLCTFHSSIGMVATFTVQATSGVGSVNNSTTLAAYPNPAMNTIHLDLSGMTGAVQIAIIDAVGREVGTRNTEGAKGVDLATGDLANGTYVVRATSKNGVVTQRITIAH